jgi:pyruvate formate lyase activating enzyme
MIFNIQRFSTHDGDGVRTLIFYKGCPLRCQWCSNPESQSFKPSVLYDSRICKHFGDCALEVPEAIRKSADNGLTIRRELVPDPERLRNVCAARALSISGEERTVDELMAEVRKDLPFYREDGGVTLSGGEPLAQGKQLDLFLKRLKEERISCHMETSLHVSWKQVERTIGLVGTYLVDLKHIETEKFKHYTNGDASLVLENLKQLTLAEARVVVRIPLIPGFNHSQREIREMVDWIHSLGGISEIHFLPYHTFGVEKYRMLGMEYQFSDAVQVRENELQPYVQYAESKGFTTKIGG